MFVKRVRCSLRWRNNLTTIGRLLVPTPSASHPLNIRNSLRALILVTRFPTAVFGIGGARRRLLAQLTVKDGRVWYERPSE